jgi:hypothetical protein
MASAAAGRAAVGRFATARERTPGFGEEGRTGIV